MDMHRQGKIGFYAFNSIQDQQKRMIVGPIDTSIAFNSIQDQREDMECSESSRQSLFQFYPRSTHHLHKVLML